MYIWGFIVIRAVVRFWNPRVLAIMGGHNQPPLVGIGLTELPNSRGAKAPSAPPLTTALYLCNGFTEVLNNFGRSDTDMV